MTQVRRSVLVALVGLLPVVVACGGGPASGTGAGSREDTSGGLGVPQQFATERFPGRRAPLEVRVELAPDGCFLGSVPDAPDASRLLVVWPAGTEQGSSGEQLRLPGGAAVEDGDLVAADGMVMPTHRLEGIGAGGYWDAAVGFCTPDASEVLVLDTAATR